jgi:hypothetical protein
MLESIAWISLLIAFACAFNISIDEYSHPQKIWIMNIVWPLTALYFSFFALWRYFSAGRKMSKTAMSAVNAEEHRREMEQARRDPTSTQTAIADTHCAAGCVLGDLIAEYSLFGLGWTLFGRPLDAEYVAICCLRGSLASRSNIHHQANAKPFPSRGPKGSAKVRYVSYHHLRDWVVCLDGVNVFRLLSPSPSKTNRSYILVHDANRNGVGLPHLVPDESMADKGRVESSDGLGGLSCESSGSRQQWRRHSV